MKSTLSTPGGQVCAASTIQDEKLSYILKNGYDFGSLYLSGDTLRRQPALANAALARLQRPPSIVVIAPPPSIPDDIVDDIPNVSAEQLNDTHAQTELKGSKEATGSFVVTAKNSENEPQPARSDMTIDTTLSKPMPKINAKTADIKLKEANAGLSIGTQEREPVSNIKSKGKPTAGNLHKRLPIAAASLPEKVPRSMPKYPIQFSTYASSSLGPSAMNSAETSNPSLPGSFTLPSHTPSPPMLWPAPTAPLPPKKKDSKTNGILVRPIGNAKVEKSPTSTPFETIAKKAKSNEAVSSVILGKSKPKGKKVAAPGQGPLNATLASGSQAGPSSNISAPTSSPPALSAPSGDVMLTGGSLSATPDGTTPPALPQGLAGDTASTATYAQQPENASLTPSASVAVEAGGLPQPLSADKASLAPLSIAAPSCGGSSAILPIQAAEAGTLSVNDGMPSESTSAQAPLISFHEPTTAVGAKRQTSEAVAKPAVGEAKLFAAKKVKTATGTKILKPALKNSNTATAAATAVLDAKKKAMKLSRRVSFPEQAVESDGAGPSAVSGTEAISASPHADPPMQGTDVVGAGVVPAESTSQPVMTIAEAITSTVTAPTSEQQLTSVAEANQVAATPSLPELAEQSIPVVSSAGAVSEFAGTPCGAGASSSDSAIPDQQRVGTFDLSDLVGALSEIPAKSAQGPERHGKAARKARSKEQADLYKKPKAEAKLGSKPTLWGNAKKDDKGKEARRREKFKQKQQQQLGAEQPQTAPSASSSTSGQSRAVSSAEKTISARNSLKPKKETSDATHKVKKNGAASKSAKPPLKAAVFSNVQAESKAQRQRADAAAFSIEGLLARPSQPPQPSQPPSAFNIVSLLLTPENNAPVAVSAEAIASTSSTAATASTVGYTYTSVM
ncbi:hypothetical protein HDU96_006236 [Phlyctochytrium bullatum]|nr:hypothetical protein HDU96_006236 [Phlyctochytrium bullatum]